MSGVTWVKEELGSSFNLTYFVELKYYLGVSFDHKGTKMLVQQSAYCTCVLELFRMDFVKSAPTPIAGNIYTFLKKGASSEVW